MTVQHILYKSIRPDPKWKYRLYEVVDLNREDPVLAKSMTLAGVLSPLVLLQDQNDFVILDGFKRHRFLEDNAALKVPSFLYSIQQAKEGFLHGLVLNEARQPLSVIEKSNVVKIVQSFSNAKGVDEDFQNQIYDFLDIPPQRQFIRKYLAINAFPDSAKKYFHEFQFSLRQIERIMPVSIPGLLLWIELAQGLRIKAQEFVQLVEIIWDISLRENTPVDQLYENLGIKELFKSNQPISQQLSDLKDFMYQKRYPLLHQIQGRIEKQIAQVRKESKLPLQISWDKNLEQSGYWINIYLDNENTITDFRKLLESSELEDGLKKLFRIIIKGLVYDLVEENSHETS